MFDAQAYVEGLLMDNSIISLTGDKTVHYIHALSPTPQYIEYEFLNVDGALYAEGQPVENEFYLQVDVFSLGSFKPLSRAIKSKLVSAGFQVENGGQDLYEKDTKLYHNAMRFYFNAENN